MLASWIGHDRQARLIVRESGEVLWISVAAQKALAHEAPLVLRDGWLTGPTQQRTNHLKLLLRSVTAAAPHWFLEEDDALIWAQHIEAEGAACIGLTLRPTGEDFDVSALAEARRLTTAETRILSMMLSGIEGARIAEELEISVETLRTHVKHIYRKLGVNSRGSLFAMAMLFRPV
jgi:DNA-binding CsgD family transcriptional regulator